MASTTKAYHLRPFLRWAGSKRQLLPILARYWPPQADRYLEPFLGSGSLFFHLRPRTAVLGDINSDLIHTYEQVRDNCGEVSQALSNMPKGKQEYYNVRALNPLSLSAPQRAARFIYLNRFAFNGLYRTNRKGEFNVPYGGERSGRIPSEQLLQDCGEVLGAAELISGDFEVVLQQASPGDFVYLDPPYRVTARRVFSEYDPSAFGPGDVRRLRSWLEKLTDSEIRFLISYAKCDEAEMLRKDFGSVEVSVRRNIAGFTAHRRQAGEWLISNGEMVAQRS